MLGVSGFWIAVFRWRGGGVVDDRVMAPSRAWLLESERDAARADDMRKLVRLVMGVQGFEQRPDGRWHEVSTPRVDRRL